MPELKMSKTIRLNWPEDFINKIICGDSLSVMKEMPDECIDMVITSPPYWGLRDYGIEQIFGGDKDCEHQWGNEINGKKLRGTDTGNRKEVYPEIHLSGSNICLKCQAWKGQLGLEPIPELYIEHMTEIFNEVKRILKKEGTFWLNIGDTYWGGKGKSGYELPHEAEERRQKGETIQHSYNVPGYMETRPPDGKHDFIQPKSLSMIPERLAWSLIQNGWILRNKIPWIKPNCMPSSAKDRYTNKWEYIFYFAKSRRNYFDLDSIRETHKESSRERFESSPYTGGQSKEYKNEKAKFPKHGGWITEGIYLNPKGKNPGDIWIINTQSCPFKNVHFATFPEKLCKKAIIPGSPKDGIVLDPFCGVGTALYVVKQLRRRFIGIDIKKEYCELAEKRLAQGVL